MELVRRPWEEYLVPTALGLMGGIALGLLAPSLAVKANETSGGFGEATERAFAETLSRLGQVMQGDFSDTGAWAFPLIGLMVGAFIHYLSAEPEI